LRYPLGFEMLGKPGESVVQASNGVLGYIVRKPDA
jgi:hypothetical protein